MRDRVRSAARVAGGRWVGIAVAACLVLGGASAAQARVVYIHGKAYGVFFKPGALPASNPLGPASTLTVGGAQPPLTYNGGPLMLSSKLYLIFWGPSGSFASSYSGPIIQWAKDLQTDQAKTTDEFTVGEEYANGLGQHIGSSVSYGGAIFDTTAYPAIDTAGGCSAADAPCVTDAQIQTQIFNDIVAQGWPTDPASAPVAQYLLLTPKGTNSCDGPGSCTYSSSGFCAYHSQITGISPGSQVATYSNLPYLAGCDSGQAPAGVQGNADTDGTLDSAIHEVVESTTDPAGTGYLDSSGNEIGDKCTYPVVNSVQTIYGTPLGGSLAGFTAFNQLIGGHTYYTQMLWSNAPTKTPSQTAAAGCVARLGPSPSFIPPSTTQTAGVAVALNGSGSTEVNSPIASYTWSWGDGTPAGTGAQASHVYYKAGTFPVSLRVADATGTANSSVETRLVKVSGSTLPPSISSFSPSTGVAGSTTVTIDGTNLADPIVNFNGLRAAVLSSSGTQVSARVPNGTTAGDITVTTDAGTATSATAFTPSLSISSLSPASGPSGTLVTIAGVGFNGSSTVKFHGTLAASVAHVSSTELQATVPAGATTGTITVTNSTAPTGTTASRTSFTVS